MHTHKKKKNGNPGSSGPCLLQFMLCSAPSCAESHSWWPTAQDEVRIGTATSTLGVWVLRQLLTLWGNRWLRHENTQAARCRGLHGRSQHWGAGWVKPNPGTLWIINAAPAGIWLPLLVILKRELTLSGPFQIPDLQKPWKTKDYVIEKKLCVLVWVYH